MGFYHLQNVDYFSKKRIVDTDVVNDVTSTQVLIYVVWSYVFYDLTLCTEYQRRHMINFICLIYSIFMYLRIAGYRNPQKLKNAEYFRDFLRDKNRNNLHL